MGYIDEGLDEVQRATPITGVNVCIYDDFEDIGNKLETIGNFDTVEEAQNFIDNYEGEAELVMYEAEELTEYRSKDPSYTPQKNHSIQNYISMAEDDYEKGTTRNNDEYEKINYHSNGEFNEPHRTIYEEKLNKNGTGVKRATRGVNPKKTKAKVLQFVYVSKSECDICRQYDGKAFSTDSPNRPIIPRLESQGKKGTRPYTHPNCKCKWVRPFSDAGIKNFDDVRGDTFTSGGVTGLKTSNESGNYAKVKSKLYKRAVAKYGKKFFNLPKSRKHYIIMQEIMKELKSHESFQPINLLKTSYNAIEPTLNLDRMRHTHSNEVRVLIDEMVGESLTSERKHDIVLEHNLDFTFENLLDLTAVALFEALNEEEKIGMDVEMEFTDDEEKAKDTVEDHLDEDPEHYSRLKSVFEHDVWDEEKNKLVDPSLLEDNKDEEASENDEQYMPDVYNIDPYPHRHEFIDNVCIICDYVLKANEDYDDHSCPTCHDKPYDCCCLYCDTDRAEGGIYDCKNCGRTKGNMHYGESKASEYHQLELDIVQKYEGSPIQVKNNMAKNMGFKNWKEMIGKLKMRIKLDENGDTFEELSDAERNAWLNIFELDPNTSSLYESKASEDHSKPYTDKFGKRHVSWTCPKCGEEFGIAGHSGEGERFEHLMSHESKATEIYTEEDEIKRLDKQNNELAGILSRMNANKIEMLKIDIRWEQKRLEDIENNIHPDEFYELYNERVKAQLLSHSKRKLESKKQELKELTGESKATEGGSELWAYAFRTTRRNFSTPIYHIVKKKSGISPSLCGVHCDTSNAKVDATYTEFGKTFEADKCEKCLRLSHGYESKATEGGRGSGRKGHQKWMLGAEADPEECPNCMIFTEKKNGNCQICGNSY